MKFIALYLTFEVMTGGMKFKSESKFDDKFSERFFKTSEITEIRKDLTVHAYSLYDKQYYDRNLCEIEVQGKIAYVRGVCSDVAKEVNGECR